MVNEGDTKKGGRERRDKKAVVTLNEGDTKREGSRKTPRRNVNHYKPTMWKVGVEEGETRKLW